MRPALAAGLLALALAVAAVPTHAQSAAASHRVEGEPTHASNLRDREFGVATRQFGLQRRVEMYQWRRGDDGRYRKVWWDRPVDSSDYADAYRNPGAFPLTTRYWVAEGVRLDGKPLDDEVLRKLGTWRAFRPGFTSLPGNLAATFQPEGDGLVSAENPLDPRVGDLRVTWQELVLPVLHDQVALRDGAWILARHKPDPTAVQAPRRGTESTAQVPGRQPWWRSVIGLTLLGLVVAIGVYWGWRIWSARRHAARLERKRS